MLTLFKGELSYHDIMRGMTYKEMIGKQFGSLRVIRKASKEETPWKSHSTPLVCTCIECNVTSIMRKEDVEKGCV